MYRILKGIGSFSGGEYFSQRLLAPSFHFFLGEHFNEQIYSLWTLEPGAPPRPAFKLAC